MQEYFIALIISSLISFFVVLGLVPQMIKRLNKKNWTVKDVNRIGGALIPRPGGPAILAGIVAAEISLYFLLPREEIITKGITALLLTTSIAFIIGFIEIGRAHV